MFTDEVDCVGIGVLVLVPIGSETGVCEHPGGVLELRRAADVSMLPASSFCVHGVEW